MDFSILFNNCPSILDIWERTHKHILKFLSSNEGTISCKSIKSKLCKLSTDNISESKVYIIKLYLEINFNFQSRRYNIMGTPWVFSTWQRIVIKENGKKNTIRFTIADSQESFLLVARSYEEAEEHLRYKSSQSLHIQP